MTQYYGESQEKIILEAAVEGDMTKIPLGAPKVLKQTEDQNSRNALHLAAFHGHVHLVKALLDAKMDVAARDHQGDTPLHLAAYNGRSLVAAVLLERRADVNATNDSLARPLHDAAMRDYSGMMIHQLLESKANINARKREEQTALHIATLYNKPEAVQTLLAAKCDYTLEDSEGMTAYQIAVTANKQQIAEQIKLRADQDSDLAALDKSLGSIVRLSISSTDDPLALHQAALRGDVSKVKELLSPVSVKQDGSHFNTPLHGALCCYNPFFRKEVASPLLMSGANRLGGNDRNTPLHWALWCSDPSSRREVASLLLRSGANLRAANSQGITPLDMVKDDSDLTLFLKDEAQLALYIAVLRRDVRGVKELLDQGLLPDGRPNKQQITALHFALACSDPVAREAMVKMLLKAGANPKIENEMGETALDVVKGDSALTQLLTQAVKAENRSRGVAFFRGLRAGAGEGPMTKTMRKAILDSPESAVNAFEALRVVGRLAGFSSRLG